MTAAPVPKSRCRPLPKRMITFSGRDSVPLCITLSLNEWTGEQNINLWCMGIPRGIIMGRAVQWDGSEQARWMLSSNNIKPQGYRMYAESIHGIDTYYCRNLHLHPIRSRSNCDCDNVVLFICLDLPPRHVGAIAVHVSRPHVRVSSASCGGVSSRMYSLIR